MRLLIVDAQVFHTPALHRGMGKYSLELLEAVMAVNGQEKRWDAVELLVSSKMPLPEEAESLLTRKAKGATVTKLPLQEDMIYSARQVMEANRQIIDRYIKQKRTNGATDIDFLILSPLQGGISCVFPSNSAVTKSLICYDLIPFMLHRTYFRNPIAQIENLTKLTELLTADVFLAISKTVANDLSVYLGIDPRRIRSIDGGPIHHAVKQEPIQVPQPFILMPTGNDIRKNNRTGILGFHEFNQRHNGQYSLVITSFFEPEQVAELSSLAPNVIFSGNITGGQLDYLYEHCEALLFPSEYEGLGLPVLEAVEKSRPIACSDISVFREISTEAFIFFNPAYSTDIAQALERAVKLKIKKTQYAAILAQYDWSRSASALLEALSTALPAEITGSKRELVVVTQNPAVDNELAGMGQVMHAALGRYFTVSYRLAGKASRNKAPRPNMLQYTADASDITGASEIKLPAGQPILYHLSNTPACTKTLFTALANPGVLLLYDLDLGQAWQAMQEQGLISQERLDAEHSLQNQYATAASNLLCSLLERQQAIGVFSQQAQEVVMHILQSLHVSIPVQVLPFPVAALVYDDITPPKEAIGIFGSGSGQLAPAELGALYGEVPCLTIARAEQVTPVGPTEKIVQTDMEFEEAINRLAFAVGFEKQQIPELYKTARYGAIPLYTSQTSTDIALPPNVWQTADVPTLANRVASSQPATKQFMELSHELLQAIKDKHSFQQFAAELHALIEEGNGI